MEYIQKKMNLALAHFEKELNSLRTSRATPSMLDSLFVEVYGAKTPINQLGNISVIDPSMLTLQVWDISMIKQIETAIIDSNLGINPQIDGQLIRLPIPKLSEERRKELTKIASEYAENAKISTRNIRRDSIDFNKKEKKESNLSEDALKKNIDSIQKITDENIKKIDQILEQKKIDILKV